MHHPANALCKTARTVCQLKNSHRKTL